ncbi:uncharacterized protein [Periplaneta americana]|uniref:uncharacterized protein n=1 Tax=Periplaneta americana TaxID=6978 RepID=UPI0037E6FCDD
MGTFLLYYAIGAVAEICWCNVPSGAEREVWSSVRCCHYFRACYEEAQREAFQLADDCCREIFATRRWESMPWDEIMVNIVPHLLVGEMYDDRQYGSLTRGSSGRYLQPH